MSRAISFGRSASFRGMRRLARWIIPFLTLTLLAAAVYSLHESIGIQFNGWHFLTVERACLCVLFRPDEPFGTIRLAHGVETDILLPRSWWPKSGFDTTERVFWLEFPLIHPIAFGVLCTVLLWRRAFQRRNSGCCPACGYSLTSLSPLAPCPECGAARERSANGKNDT